MIFDILFGTKTVLFFKSKVLIIDEVEIYFFSYKRKKAAIDRLTTSDSIFEKFDKNADFL